MPTISDHEAMLTSLLIASQSLVADFQALADKLTILEQQIHALLAHTQPDGYEQNANAPK